MAEIHIPNDSSQATHEAIDAAQPGDELRFDADGFGATGYGAIYTFTKTVEIKKDRYYVLSNKRITVSDDFQGEYLFTVEDGAEHYIIANCSIDVREKCTIFAYPPDGMLGHADDNIIIMEEQPTLHSI